MDLPYCNKEICEEYNSGVKRNSAGSLAASPWGESVLFMYESTFKWTPLTARN